MRQLSLTVHRTGEEYFATRHFGPGGPGSIGEEIFTITSDDKDIEALEDRARKMASEKGILFVRSLDYKK